MVSRLCEFIRILCSWIMRKRSRHGGLSYRSVRKLKKIGLLISANQEQNGRQSPKRGENSRGGYKRVSCENM